MQNHQPNKKSQGKTTLNLKLSTITFTLEIILIIGATIYLSTCIITAPLLGAINKTDTKNLKEMIKTLSPLAPILTTPLNLIEHLTTKFQKT